MSSPGAGAARLVRGVVLSVLVVALSAIAHGLGGGNAPSPGMLAGLGVLLLPACVWVAGRQVRPWTAGLLLACGQAVLHWAFSFLMACPTVATGTTLIGSGHAGHGSTAMAVHCAAMAPPGRPLLGGASMLVFHAVATVLTAVVVGGAERLVWWVRREITARLTPPAPSLAVTRPVRALLLWGFLAPAQALHLRAQPARRGPPPRLVAFGV